MVATSSPYWVNHSGRLLHSVLWRERRRQGMLSTKRAATLSLHAPQDVVARAASSHCCGRLRRDAAVSVRAARLGATCLCYLAVPRFVGRTRPECLATHHSLRPKHLGRSVRTSKQVISFFGVVPVILAYVQLLNVSRKGRRPMNQRSFRRRRSQ
jgi:hypothetical protein